MAKQKKEFNYNDPFPKRLRALIKQKGITFDVLAEEVGTTRQTVSNWQNGSTVPDAVSLRYMANYFSVTTDYLLGLTDSSTIEKDVRAAADLTGLSTKAIEQLRLLSIYPAKKTDGNFEESLAFWISNIIEDGTLAKFCSNLALFHESAYDNAQRVLKMKKKYTEASENGTLYETVYNDMTLIPGTYKTTAKPFSQFKEDAERFKDFSTWVDSYTSMKSLANAVLEDCYENAAVEDMSEFFQYKIQRIITKKLVDVNDLAIGAAAVMAAVGESNGTDNKENR